MGERGTAGEEEGKESGEREGTGIYGVKRIGKVNIGEKVIKEREERGREKKGGGRQEK